MSVQEVESFSQQSARKIFEKQKCLDGVSRMTLFPLGDIFLQSLRFYNMDISVAIYINPDTTDMPLYQPGHHTHASISTRTPHTCLYINPDTTHMPDINPDIVI